MIFRLNQFFAARRNRHPLFVFLVGLCITLAIATLQSPTMAQSTVSRGTIAEILDGSQVFIQSNQARVNDVANRGQQVRTENARAQVMFNTGAVARLSRNSVLTIGQCAQLQRGTLLVNGAVNGCTSSVTAGVRGTTYLMSVNEEGEEEIQVLEGEVTVSRQAASGTNEPASNGNNPAPATPPTPSPAPSHGGGGLLGRLGNVVRPATEEPGDSGDGNSVVLTAGQEVAIRPGERLSRPRFMSVNDFVDILTGQLFDGFISELPGLSKIREAFQQLFPGTPFPLDGGSSILNRPF